jgi:hypothetical protein
MNVTSSIMFVSQAKAAIIIAIPNELRNNFGVKKG